MLSIIDEGRRTATYKLAVLLALIDCCSSASDDAGGAPSQVSTRDLARRVVELYWPQVRPYGSRGDGLLRQSSQPRALTVEAVAQLRRATVGAATLDVAERMASEATRGCLDVVELNLVRMPLGKLQRPAGYDERNNADYPRFLYDDRPFHEGVTRKRLQREPMMVEISPGSGDYLISLAALLRPLIELHWTREVARFNRMTLGEDDLRDFLFGATRVALHRLRPGLLDVQAGRCFYCRRPFRRGDIHVDHFIPWSRVPNDGLANLVLADGRCNGNKSHHYADVSLVERWALRPRDVLAQLAEDARWPTRLGESLAIARGLYAHLPDGTRLWTAVGVFTLLDRTLLDDVLGVIAL